MPKLNTEFTTSKARGKAEVAAWGPPAEALGMEGAKELPQREKKSAFLPVKYSDTRTNGSQDFSQPCANRVSLWTQAGVSRNRHHMVGRRGKLRNSSRELATVSP